MTAPGQIGRYQIIGPLASGGMAEIHLARLSGPSGFERIVVVKRILPHLAREKSFVSMFLDEARIVSGIRHPNVVQVQELGHEDGELFLVMEYLEGESAGSLVKRSTARNEPLHPLMGAYIIAEACAGLHAAHELTDAAGAPQNIVHRDVSPQNLFLTYAGEVKMLDFGIAKAADRITRTEAGQLKGKFEYMSPEQCRGGDLDRRSDVFSLGVLLYELTTGRRLFKRATQLQTLKAIPEEPIVPPSRVLDGYPGELEVIVIKALSRRRVDRYATAADMRRELLAAIQRTRPSDDSGDWLGRVMERLFEDRIREKREMVRNVQRGGPVNVPSGEIEFVDDPMAQHASEGTESASLLETPSAAARTAEGRGRATMVVWSAIGLAILTTVALVAMRGGAPSLSTVPAPAPPSAIPSVEGSPPAPSATQAVLHVESRPPGATVTLAGSGRGTTPLDLMLDRSNASMTLELKKAGYQSLTQTIVPDVDQRVVVSLEPEPPSRAPLPTRRNVRTPTAASPTATASATASPFQRFD